MRYKITPVGQEKERLLENCGLDCYHINGEVKPDTVQFGWAFIQVWLFRFEDVEEEVVRQHMVKVRARDTNVTEEQALEWLKAHYQGVPRSQVIVSPLPQ